MPSTLTVHRATSLAVSASACGLDAPSLPAGWSPLGRWLAARAALPEWDVAAPTAAVRAERVTGGTDRVTAKMGEATTLFLLVSLRLAWCLRPGPSPDQ